ncbi:MAG TPA: LCP family protein [Mycobacteriales bacterium]|nr:LCP family protein [Mycobacteriales bacterium]
MVWTSAALVVVLAGVGAFGYFTYKHYDGRIHRADTLAQNDPHIVEKTKQEHAQNFLLIGSDTRSGANGKYETSSGEVAGARSDTTILAHLSPDGGKATMVSFPRDSWVHVPECKKADGSTSKPYDGMFNSAFELGGAACTIRLVQELTGVEITHSVQIDFTGFKTMVSALGGVPVCTPIPIDDPDSGLHLKKGTTTLSGDQALAYVRARHNIGDGSDLGRITRQQQFLGSMIRVATSTGILFSPGKLKKFLDAATTSVTLDKHTHLADLYGLAQQMHHLDAAHANFLTVPIANPDYTPPGQSSGGRVQLDLAAAKPLWKSIIDDNATVTVPVNGASSPKPTSKSTAKASRHAPAPKLTVAPQDVTVRVVNGVGTRNLATRASADLTSAGFTVSTLSVEPSGATRPVVQYAPAELAAARTLAAAVPGAVMQADAAAGAGQVVLVVGSAYTGAHTVAVGDAQPSGSTRMAGSDHTAKSPTPSALKSVSAADKTCSV